MTIKKVIIKKTNDILYTEVLDNGLHIFMIPQNDINTTYVSFTTRYGGMHNEFIPFGEKKMRKVPEGIAHFLEHKMFEQEDGVDPMLFYSQNGADVNAYTSLYATSYHFSCSDYLKENLEYLLNFVQAPYFTDENVEKEKGIIEEEIKMYNDNPYSLLGEGIRANGFKNHPLKHPIAGTIDDIRSITKENLYTCYHTFYHPSNMFVVVSGKFDVKEVLNIIKENQSSKEFEKNNTITLKRFKEPDQVVNSYEEKQMNVEVSKISYGIKMPIKNIKMEPKRRAIYLAIMFESLFGSTSKFKEEMKEKGYLISSVSLGTYYTDDHLFVTISADTEYASELLAAIKETLNNSEVSEEEFNRKVKVVASDEIYTYEDAEYVNRHIVDNLVIYNKYYPNMDDILNNLNMDEFNKLRKQLDFNNTTSLVIKPFVNKGV
ncbi:MAG: pitrilysin family protein [Bacilli bacterium]|nr:pitrilysin family protein [Bacilli bacterium]